MELHISANLFTTLLLIVFYSTFFLVNTGALLAATFLVFKYIQNRFIVMGLTGVFFIALCIIWGILLISLYRDFSGIGWFS